MKTTEKKELTSRIKKVEALRAQLKAAEKTVAKDIMSLLQVFIKENPLVKSLRWNQYTPHFNDGDTCEFGVNGPELLFDESVLNQEEIKDIKENEDDDYYKWMGAGEYGEIDNDWFDRRMDVLNHKEIAKLKKSVNEAVGLFEKLSTMNELQGMFGDGVQITVTAEGVETEDYDHD